MKSWAYAWVLLAAVALSCGHVTRDFGTTPESTGGNAGTSSADAGAGASLTNASGNTGIAEAGMGGDSATEPVPGGNEGGSSCVDVSGPVECDDGNQNDGDGCEHDCQFSCVSSDAMRDCQPKDPCEGESHCNDKTHACSPRTPLKEGATCDTNSVCRQHLCTGAHCGDKVVDRDEGEECDDGNLVSADGCENNCKWTCSSADFTRNCHTANPCDGSSECADTHVCLPRRALSDGDSCGTMASPAFCRNSNCIAARCGNGFVEAGEDCDDSNAVAGDGCESNCKWSCQPGKSRSCLNAKGNCAAGTETCQPKGTWGPCTIQPKSVDSCDVANDDADCDGTANRNCACVSGTSRPCGHATVGICVRGTQQCMTAQWQGCNSTEPKAHDCRSALDNDCNGTADNLELTSCKCMVDASRPCNQHAGLDGKGICHPGAQKCLASSDGTTSDWDSGSNSCVGAVGPNTELCNADMVDEDCDGNALNGCSCTNGVPVSCGVCGTAPCVNGTSGACTEPALATVTYYRDGDGDGFGNAAMSMTSCSGLPTGYVRNTTDCDDGNPAVVPGYKTCLSSSAALCVSGAWQTRTCVEGCITGECRLGVPGSVWCSGSNVECALGGSLRCCQNNRMCLTSCMDGSDPQCDGPEDCPGQVCCHTFGNVGEPTVRCQTAANCVDIPYNGSTQPPFGVPKYTEIVCNPNHAPSDCTGGKTCLAATESYTRDFYTCR